MNVNALIVATTDKSRVAVSELLSGSGFTLCQAVDEKAAADFVRDRVCALAVINAPLANSSGIELACHIAETDSCTVLLLIPEKACAAVKKKVEGSGIVVLSKPLDKNQFLLAVAMASSFYTRFNGLFAEKQALVSRLETTKLVDRAKCTLMQCLMITEKEAHRYIEKQAMDMRMDKKSVALEILKLYET